MKKVLFSLAVTMVAIAISSFVVLAIQPKQSDHPFFTAMTESYDDLKTHQASLSFIGMSDGDDTLFHSHILQQCATWHDTFLEWAELLLKILAGIFLALVLFKK